MRTLWLFTSLMLFSAGCSEDGDGNGGNGGGTGGGGGTAGASGTAGVSASGTGGSGGTATTGGSGGSPGSGGASGTTSGTGGSGGRMVPQPTGTIGNAPVPCAPVECAVGSACCRAITAYTCVTSFPACECSVQGNCTVVGCDSDADCSGGVCCALRNTKIAPGYVATSCKAACEAGEPSVCVNDQDCDPPNTCERTTSGFSVCF